MPVRSIFALFLLASPASAADINLEPDVAAKAVAFLLRQTTPSDANADVGTTTFRSQITCPNLDFIGTEVLLRLSPSGSPTLVAFATMKSEDGVFELMTVTMIDEGANGTVDRVEGVGTESRKAYDRSNAYQSVLSCYLVQLAKK